VGPNGRIGDRFSIALIRRILQHHEHAGPNASMKGAVDLILDPKVIFETGVTVMFMQNSQESKRNVPVLLCQISALNASSNDNWADSVLTPARTTNIPIDAKRSSVAMSVGTPSGPFCTNCLTGLALFEDPFTNCALISRFERTRRNLIGSASILSEQFQLPG
jgi:hypothetical protein